MAEEMNKWTPGPWRSEGNSVYTQAGLNRIRTSYYGGNAEAYDSRLNTQICTLDDGEYLIYLGVEEMKANARLIAAAPEMAGFLEWCADSRNLGIHRETRRIAKELLKKIKEEK